MTTARITCQFVEIFYKRHNRAVEALDLRIGRFNDVILVGRVGAAGMAETRMTDNELERFTVKT